ncbi:MAG: hypothetical protein WA821_10515 [Anaerolineales bacterium]
MSQLSSHDAELLSAYLDGQLSKADAGQLESRLKTDPELRTVYEGLRQSRAVLRKLPARRAPRNFTLTPQMAGVKPPLPRSFPVFRLASALAAVLFFIGYALNLSTPLLASAPTAAPLAAGAPAAVEMMATAPAATSAPKLAATQAISAAPQNGLAPTATSEPMTLAAPPSEAASQRNLVPQPAEPPSLPVDPAWLFVLLGLAVLSGAIAFIIRLQTERNWSKANAAAPARQGGRKWFLIVLVAVAVLLLLAAIYWMATDFFAPIPQPLGSEGNAVAVAEQEVPIGPGLGYEFTITDNKGPVTTISFPANAVKEATVLHFVSGLDIMAPDHVAHSFPDHAFSLFPPPGSGSLQAPMTIRMGYGVDVSSVVDENKLALYWWSGDQWRDAAATCKPASTYIHLPARHQISLPVCQFGIFLLVAP